MTLLVILVSFGSSRCFTHTFNVFDDADFHYDEASVRTSWSRKIGDFSAKLRRWSGAENVLSVEESVSVSSVELFENDALRGQHSTEGILNDLVSFPAALDAPAGQAIGTRDIDSFLLQGKQDIQTAHFDDQSLVDTSTDNDSSSATSGFVDAPSIIEFVQRSRAISDATVKPDSWSPSAPCLPSSPVALIPATFFDANLDDRADILQALEYRSMDAQATEILSTEAAAATLAHEVGESLNLNSASVLESMLYDCGEKHSSVSVRTESLAIHRAPQNTTIRISSTFEAKPSSSASAQSLPLILSLSNERDTKRWFSFHTDVFLSAANSLPRLQPHQIFHREKQEAQRYRLVFDPEGRCRVFNAISANAALQQLSFLAPNPSSTDRLLSSVELQQESFTTRLKPLRLSSLLNPRPSLSSSSSIMSNISFDHSFSSFSPHSPSVSSSTSLSHNSLVPAFTMFIKHTWVYPRAYSQYCHARS
ncbi:hypothetical protein BDR07DRAFT_1478236 [Suillus spraguei]|nr:hypothetical protein BDR07DRAFT_1478231 [Suillus spraguei]KAG2368464.1 hypothetical protein BDR07DRAFT_1478236 [Suillus spraguei]